MRLYTPVGQGRSRGLVRSEIIVDKKTTSHSLGDREQHGPLSAGSDPTTPRLTLTVRDRRDGPRQTVPRSQWQHRGSARAS